MHAGTAPQHDFFIYVPLTHEQEKNAKARRVSTQREEQLLRDMKSNSRFALTTWTRVALPGHFTIYTRPCGEED